MVGSSDDVDSIYIDFCSTAVIANISENVEGELFRRQCPKVETTVDIPYDGRDHHVLARSIKSFVSRRTNSEWVTVCDKILSALSRVMKYSFQKCELMKKLIDRRLNFSSFMKSQEWVILAKRDRVRI